ncbi:hypothetical protein ACIBH1_07680 [Nonomuraea sp. NPDC050663]|uniref:hypothetical protein n=1 Tax=Nonomuraea sp. NPDC050663 TaxID=3364370 RepID=UPI00378E9F05
MKRVTTVVLALSVHLTTLAFLLLGLWVILVNRTLWPAWLLGGLLIAVGVLLRPRRQRVPADAEVLDRALAQVLYGTAERVAHACGALQPKAVAIRDLGTTSEYVRGVLVIGLPAWLTLSPAERAEHLSEVFRRRDRGLLVESALATLEAWRDALLHSAPLSSRVEANTQMSSTISLGAPDTTYEVTGMLGRTLGRVFAGPVLLAERGLTALAGPPAAPRPLDSRRIAPIQAAALRGESVEAIRRGVLERVPEGTNALLTDETSAAIDHELSRHYVRAVRGFGLIS